MILRVGEAEHNITPENSLVLRYDKQSMANGLYCDMEEQYLFVSDEVNDSQVTKQAEQEGIHIVRVLDTPDWDAEPHCHVYKSLARILILEVEEHVREV